MAATKKPSKAHTPTNQAAKRKIFDAATRLFEENGSQSISMAEIAKEAGISRNTLYRVFDRPTMIEELLEHQLEILGKKLRVKVRSYEDVEEALIEGAVASVAAARRDTLINNIVLKETDHRLEGFMLRGSETLRRDLYKMWSPVIEKGRKEELVRPNLSNERITELIMSTTSILLMRDDLSRNELREFIKDALVPAILKK